MTNNIDQSNPPVTRRARSPKPVTTWGWALSGSLLGSFVVAILGYILARVNYPARASEGSAELLAAVLGFF
jgi:hypothetical protein